MRGADRAAVLVHGRGRNRVNSDFMEAAIARLLLAHGYPVLLFDLRGHGESGGTRYTVGIEEPRDNLLMTVEADSTIGPVVTDAAFADGNTIVSEAATLYTHTVTGRRRAHPERAFLFIQCTDDTTVILHHGLDLKAASANPRTELWIVPGCEQGIRHTPGRVGAARPRFPESRGRRRENVGEPGRYPRHTTTGRMTVSTAAKGRRVRWEDSPREDLMTGVQRRFLQGEKAMLAQIWLKKGTSVPKHIHPAEQLSFIVEGALRLRLGDDLSEIHEVRAGEVLVIPANVPHEATALEDTYDLDVFSPPREDWIKGQDAYLRGR